MKGTISVNSNMARSEVLCRCRAIAAVLLVAALIGCVDQHQEVMTYRKVVDQGLPRPRAYQPGEPLSLERAMALANQDFEQIGLQGENYLQALIAKDRAFAAFLPTISFQPSFMAEEAPRNQLTSPAATALNSAKADGYRMSGNTWYATEAPVTGSMDLSFVSYPNLRSAEQTIVQQQQLLLDAQRTVLLEVAQTYYQVLISEKQVQVLSSTLELEKARLADAQSRFRNHLALALEVSQTRSQVAATQVALTQAQSDVRNGRHMLAFFVGVPEVDGPLADEIHLPRHIPSVDDFRRQAAAERQDLLAADAAVRASKYAVDAAIAQYYPSVSLNVSGFLYREYFSEASKWDAMVVGNLPIFSAGIIEADVRDAFSKLRQAALYQRELKRQIDRDVQIAYDNLTTSETELGNLQEEVNASEDAYHQSVHLLHNGLAINLDVLTAQDQLLNSELTYANEEFSQTLNYLDLLRIIGELNPRSPERWNAATRPSPPVRN